MQFAFISELGGEDLPHRLRRATATGVYTIEVPDSTLGQSGGSYSAGQAVTISNSLVDAVIHYTIDGATPTENDPVIASGAAITLLDDLTLKVKAFKTGCDPSDVVTASYTVTGSITPEVISAGGEHSLAIQPDDTGWAWGRNSNGQYGDGTTTRQEEPKAISALSSIMDIDGGDFFTLSVETDGTALGSGQNSNGQLGDGSTTQRTSPASVGSLTDLVAIAAGASHDLAIESDGTLWAGVLVLRHTFCSHLAMRGAPAKAIQELAGHAELTTTQRYMHLSPAAVEGAIRLLEEPRNDSRFGDMLETAEEGKRSSKE